MTLVAAIDVTVQHVDGAFQTASVLFRLKAGQLPGRDFLPYLGIGPTLLIFPGYVALGSDVTASFIAAHMTLHLAVAVGISTIWQFVFRPGSWLWSFGAGLAIQFIFLKLAYMPFVHGSSLSSLMWTMAQTGASLRPLRAALPYLVALPYFFFVLRMQNERGRHAACGLLAGLCLLWSNDFAIPTAFAFSLLVPVMALRRGEFGIANALVYTGTALLTAGFFYAVLTGGHPDRLLTYYFRDVAADQWWLFAPYDPATRIFDAGDYVRVPLQDPVILAGLGGLALMLVRMIRRPEDETILLFWIGATLLLGGSLATVGGHWSPSYFYGFALWGLLVLLFQAAEGLRTRLGPRLGPGMRRLVRAGVPGLPILFLGLYIWDGLRDLRRETAAAAADPGRIYVEELGGYLPAEWRDYLALAEAARGEDVVEEYWGIWSAYNRSFGPWPVDSAIHALGDLRPVAARAVATADVVITTRPLLSPQWQSWGLSQNYWLYEPLLKGWRVAALSPATVVWRRGSDDAAAAQALLPAAASSALSCAPDPAGSGLVVTAPAPGFYQLELAYRFEGAGRHLMMVENEISHAVDSLGFVSLDPGAERAHLPVLLQAAGERHLALDVRGDGDFRLDLRSCALVPIELPPEIRPVR